MQGVVITAYIRNGIDTQHLYHTTRRNQAEAIVRDRQLVISGTVVTNGHTHRLQCFNRRDGFRHHTGVTTGHGQFLQMSHLLRFDRILNLIRHLPILGMIKRTVIIREGEDHRTLTIIERGIATGQHRFDIRTTIVGHHWRDRQGHVGKALHLSNAVCRHRKRSRRHHIDVLPDVVPTVDNVMVIVNCRIARSRGGVHRVVQHIHRNLTYFELRSDRFVDITQTSHMFHTILDRSKLSRNDVVGKLPDGIKTRTIRILIAINDGVHTIPTSLGNTVHKHRNNTVMANIINGIHRRTFHIHPTADRSRTVSGYSRNLFRHHHMVGESPIVRMTRAIGVRIGKDNITLTTVVIAIVLGVVTRRQHVTARILHRRQSDARSRGLSVTVHRKLLVGRHSEVFRMNIVCIFPIMCSIVHGVRVVEDTLTAIFGMIHDRIADQRDGLTTNFNDGLDRFSRNVPDAMHGGILVCNLIEFLRNNHVCETPRIGIIGTILIGIVERDGTMTIRCYIYRRGAGHVRDHSSTTSI